MYDAKTVLNFIVTCLFVITLSCLTFSSSVLLVTEGLGRCSVYDPTFRISSFYIEVKVNIHVKRATE